MFSRDVIKRLEERNLISKWTNKKELMLRFKKRIAFYCGFDPTSDSLHVGHLIPLFFLKSLQEIGHKPIIVLGGATGLIGDPSFRLSKRKIQKIDQLFYNIKKISEQIYFFLNLNSSNSKVKILNNYDWFKEINILYFLCKIGKFFSINQMINKESIKKRFDQKKDGINYSEFSYHLMQSYDFSYLYKTYNVELQIGGSDQWGNIISGIHLTHCLYKKKVYGITLPLMVNLNGDKIGKTEKKTIWLNSDKTSVYDFYQFWINLNDIDVYSYLKYFTKISLDEINYLKDFCIQNPKSKKAQYLLAEHMTSFVHGENELSKAKRMSKKLFSKKLDKLEILDFLQLINDGIKKINLNIGASLVDSLLKSKIADSKSFAKKLIISNSILINGKLVTSPEYIFQNQDILYKHYTLIKKGKKVFFLIYWK
ncbi:MAG: tyrosine--tRNA ligase [Arsenophonus sp.]|nr:MAG: tyrosine--tRNA ligase [Arsenophonus sp.]